MDTLTHALSGALLARATEPKADRAVLPRRTRMAAGFWAAAFPDIDFVLRFVDPLTYVTAHRGITHSVIMLPLWAIALGLAFHLLYRRRYPWHAFAGVCALGIAAHIAGDVITSFGTMIFAPLSEWRAQWPATFIIDPYFSAIIVAGLAAAWYWKHARLPAVAGLAVLVAYVGFQTVLHARALAVAENYARAHRLTPAKAHALPQPFSPFHWLLVIEQPDVYHLSYVSLVRTRVRVPPPDAGFLRQAYDAYRPVGQALWQRVPRYGRSPEEVEAALALWDSAPFARYRRFAMFPAVFRVERSAGRICVWFADLRFALVGRSLPFRYAACRGAGGADWMMYAIDQDADGLERLQALE